jgi:hypothetical protein
MSSLGVLVTLDCSGEERVGGIIRKTIRGGVIL